MVAVVTRVVVEVKAVVMVVMVEEVKAMVGVVKAEAISAGRRCHCTDTLTLGTI